MPVSKARAQARAVGQSLTRASRVSEVVRSVYTRQLSEPGHLQVSVKSRPIPAPQPPKESEAKRPKSGG